MSPAPGSRAPTSAPSLCAGTRGPLCLNPGPQVLSGLDFLERFGLCAGSLPAGGCSLVRCVGLGRVLSACALGDPQGLGCCLRAQRLDHSRPASYWPREAGATVALPSRDTTILAPGESGSSCNSLFPVGNLRLGPPPLACRDQVPTCPLGVSTRCRTSTSRWLPRGLWAVVRGPTECGGDSPLALSDPFLQRTPPSRLP